MATRNSIRKKLVIIMTTIGVISFFSSMVFFLMLADYSPSNPIEVSQQVYQLSNHGKVFYVTSKQYWIFSGLLHGGWSLALIAALLNMRWKVVDDFTLQGWRKPD